MYYILYNEKSNGGKTTKIANKLNKKISENEQTTLLSIYDIYNNEKAFITGLKKEDSLLLVGGDGTYHEFFNRIYPVSVECKIYFYPSGRGNDMARDYKKHKPFEVTHLVNNLPKISVNGQNSYVYVNGIGMGVDSYVCREQNKNINFKVKESYFKIALRVFKKFVPYSIDIEIDGQRKHYEKVWFFVCNNGAYFGGGMKITPKAKREDEWLDICIVHNIKLVKLLIMFPLVFKGLHTHVCKKSITFLRVKNITVRPFGCDVLQLDGEVIEKVDSIEITR